MPGVMPMRPALSFTAKTFSSGGLPSKMATARARNSGSARNTAATGKFGTKMQANMKQYLVVSTQLGFSRNWVLATGYCFHPAQAVLLANVISAERTGLRSSRDRTNSAVISSPVSNCAWVGNGI